MKKLVLAALCALCLTAASGKEAKAWNPIRLGINIGCANYGVTLGFDCSANACGPCGPCGPSSHCLPCATGPWYSYFPTPCPPCYNATVSGGGFPYWPTQYTGCGY